MKRLKQQIDELNEALASQLPSNIVEVFEQSIEDLKKQNIAETSAQLGQKFPNFSLTNWKNKTIELDGLLKRGKVIVAFFRGSWCPYCNLELQALQARLKELDDRKVSLVGVSPQLSNYNQELMGNHNLEFELLTDKDNKLAQMLGISFQLQEYAVSVYNSLGINLSMFNANENNELPVPAVFVVDTDYSIVYKFVDSNYMNRLDIEELIEQL